MIKLTYSHNSGTAEQTFMDSDVSGLLLFIRQMASINATLVSVEKV